MTAVPPGPVLAIETSWDVGSVALQKGGQLLGSRYLTVRSRHADRIVPAIEELLSEAGVSQKDLDGVVVGSGPGSFTGVRVAAATAKGLVYALDLTLYPVSSLAGAARTLEALTQDGPLPEALLSGSDGGGFPHQLLPGQREIRYVLMDARRGRVYGACYDVGHDDVLEVVAPHAGTIVDVLNSRPPLGTVFMGDGAWAHAAVIRAAGFTVLGGPCGVPTAQGLLGACTWIATDGESWEPEYVREWQPG